MGYELLSNLLHLRDVPTRKSGTGDEVELDETEIARATESIKEHIPDFDYVQLLTEIKNPVALKARFDGTDVGYEKVQLFRIMSVLNPVALKGDDVFTKFVNESYHIENEYVMQLNPRHFDAVPEYVVAACTVLIEEAFIG